MSTKELQTTDGNENLPASNETISPLTTISGFEAAQRIAKALMTSDIVPLQFQGNMGNILIAQEFAHRTGSSVMAVMQNVHIIHGKLGWSSSYCIAAINQSGRFSDPLHFEFQGAENTDAWGCRAVTLSKRGKEVSGPLVTIGMAKAEGWYGKAGSKWPTMPELMLRYRAAAFFARTVVPDILFGMQTEEELIDVNPPYAAAEGNGEPIEEATLIDSVKTVDAPQEEDMRPSVNGIRIDEGARKNAMEFMDQVSDTIPDGVKVVAEEVKDEVSQVGWPKWDKGAMSWIDVHGVVYDDKAHASFTGEVPKVNADGSFKARRGAILIANQLKAEAAELKAKNDATNDRIKDAGSSVSDVISTTMEPSAITQEEGIKYPDAEDPPIIEPGEDTGLNETTKFDEWTNRLHDVTDMNGLLSLESDLRDFDKASQDNGSAMLAAKYNEMHSQNLV